MSFELEFEPSALKAWRKLAPSHATIFTRKLAERLENPRVPKDALHFRANHYKIKLRDKGYRLIYVVDDGRVTVVVVDMGRRNRIYDGF